MRNDILRALFAFPFVLMAIGGAFARAESPQATVPQPLTLGGAVAYALDHYPSVRARMAEMQAADANVGLTETAYLPKVDTLFSVNRATRNNVFGALFPQAVIPSLSGPVLGTSTSGSTFGSAAGVLVGWEPFDFGLRRANTGVAEAKKDEAAALLALTRHQVALAVADAFLAVAANQQSARAARSAVDRLTTVGDSIRPLVDAGLRPGADLARIDVEVALTRTRLIQAEGRVDESLATLAQMLGAAGVRIEIDPGGLLAAPPSGDSANPQNAVTGHPLTASRMAAIETSDARLHALDRSFVPKFTLQGALWSRGTGALTSGGFLGGANGLAPSTANGAVGASITFPLSDFASLRDKKAIEQHTHESAVAQYDEAVQQVIADLARARAAREAAEKIAANTPAELKAAETIDAQSRARYQAGLATIVEIADAQRLRAQAETDDAIARLGVWRARVSEGAAAGDISALFK